MPDKPKTHSSPGMEAERAARRKQCAQGRSRLPQQRLLWTARYKHFRKALLAEFPLCKRCERQPSLEVHHVRRLAQHPEDLCDPEHCECLCVSCHSKATAGGE